jgi:hypothetical protein
LASGQAAETLIITTLASAGDGIVSTTSLYGGTYNLFHYTLPKLGITVKFVDADDFDGLRKAIGPKTKALYTETLGNPKLDIADVEVLAKIAHDAGVPLVIDNTCATPGSAVRLSGEPTSSSIRRRSTAAGTVPRSAGSLLTRGSSTGQPRRVSRILSSLTPPITAFRTPRHLARWRSSSRRGCGVCATPARAFRRSTRFYCCKVRKLFTCGWNGTLKMPGKLRNTWQTILMWNG